MKEYINSYYGCYDCFFPVKLFIIELIFALWFGYLLCDLYYLHQKNYLKNTARWSRGIILVRVREAPSSIPGRALCRLQDIPTEYHEDDSFF